jgi:hypothetical protein
MYTLRVALYLQKGGHFDDDGSPFLSCNLETEID